MAIEEKFVYVCDLCELQKEYDDINAAIEDGWRQVYIQVEKRTEPNEWEDTDGITYSYDSVCPKCMAKFNKLFPGGVE